MAYYHIGDICVLQFDGDKKSPACYMYSREHNDSVRNEAFRQEISQRGFSTWGGRRKIIEKLIPVLPKSLGVADYADLLVKHGLDSDEIPRDVRKKITDGIAFLCCLHRSLKGNFTRNHFDVWENLGFDVERELGKSK